MKNKLCKIIIPLAALFMIPNFASAAMPTITSVSGMIATGQTIVISGMAMVDENKSDWIPLLKTGTLYGFEGAFADQVCLVGDCSEDRYSYAPDNDQMEMSYDSSIKLMGNASYKGRITGAHLSNASTGLFVASGVNQGAVFVRMYSRWHSAGTISKWPQSHIKMVDMQGGGLGPDQMYFQPVANDGTSLPHEMNLTYDSTSHPYSVDDFLQDNRWYCMEVYWNNTASPRFTTWVDGVQIADITTGLGNLSGMDAILFNMINLSDTGPDFDLSNWTDGFTVSSSRIYPASTIEVSGDGITWKYQEPIYLSDTSSQIKLNLNGLTGTNYQLRVMNNQQETSAIYILSGGGDTTAPTSPTGLSVL